MIRWRKRCLKVPMCAFGKHWEALRLLKLSIEAFQESYFRGKPLFAFYLRFPADQLHYVNLLRKFHQIDNSLKVYYTHRAAYDAFESYNPKDLVVGFKRNFDDGEKFLASEKKINKVSVLNFFELFRHPELHKLTPEFAQELKSKKIRSIVLFDNGEKSELLTNFRTVATHYKQIIRFVHANINDEQSKSLAKEALIVGDALPKIRIIDTVNEKVRVFDVSGSTAEEITQAIDQFNRGELVNLNEEVTSEL